MRAPTLVCLQCLLLLLFLGPTGERPALADPTVSDKLMTEARMHFERGVQLYEQQLYLAARDEFVRAYKLSRLPDLLFNLARAEARLGRTRDAIHHLEEYLQFPEISQRDEVRDYLEVLRQQDPPEPEPEPLIEDEPPPAPMVRQRVTRLGIAKWVLGSIGVLGIVAGATLLGLDGAQDCGQGPRQCRYVLDTWGTGVVVASGGILTVGTSALLFGLDHQRAERATPAYLLSLQGRF